MKTIRNATKLYLKELREHYSIAHLFQAITIICAGMLAIDYYDLPSKLMNTVPVFIGLVTLISAVLVTILWLREINCCDLVKIPSPNAVDICMITVMLVLCMYAPIQLFLFQNRIYKLVACVSLAAVCLVLFTIRVTKFYRAQAQYASRRHNLLDLKVIYDGTFGYRAGDPILVSEDDVDYDMLKRGGIINQLYRSITCAHSEKSYVISLEGPWGSGKTTILNNTKRMILDSCQEQEYIIIDDFDPWLYGSQEAILLALFDTLLKRVGMRYSPFRIYRMVEGLEKAVSESHIAGSVVRSLLVDRTSQVEEVQQIKKRISSFLKASGKTVVFFIDNLDRANESNILFLFKLISLIFDFPNVVYVLSFERERIDAILRDTQEFDERFTEKIIQQVVKVPALSEECIGDAYTVCLCNILNAYGISVEHIPRYKTVIRAILDNAQNPRAFKRYINSVLSQVFCEDNMLDKRDLLAIETIRFFEPELYSAIYRNRKFFVSHDLSHADSFARGLNTEKFNQDCKNFFASFLSKYPGYSKVLEEIFPFVQRYVHRYEIVSKHSFSDPDARDVIKRSRICSSKYFDLYFSYSSNNYLVVRQEVEKFVADVNGCMTASDVDICVQKNVILSGLRDQKEWFERFQNYLGDISVDKVYILAIKLLEHINEIDSTMMFLALDARARAEYIISELLMYANEKEFTDFLEYMKARYDLIDVLHKLGYWFEKSDYDSQFDPKQRAEAVYAIHKNMCIAIVDNSVNLFDDPYYHQENIWEIYRCFRDLEQLDTFANYVTKIKAGRNIYRMLWDCIGTSLGAAYMYAVDESRLNLLALNKDQIDNMLVSIPPRNESEEFVYSVYQLYKTEGTDARGEKSVKRTVAIAPIL